MRRLAVVLLVLLLPGCGSTPLPAGRRHTARAAVGGPGARPDRGPRRRAAADRQGRGRPGTLRDPRTCTRRSSATRTSTAAVSNSRTSARPRPARSRPDRLLHTALCPPPPRRGALHHGRARTGAVLLVTRRARRSAPPRCSDGRGPPWRDPLADELLERRLVAERVEVGVLLREVAEARPLLEGGPQVADRVVLAAGERLAAGEVVERRGVAARLERLAAPAR